MKSIGKVVIVAPFWREKGNIGSFRVERFVRWITSAGGEVFLLRAGSEDRVEHTAFGVEITIRDPLKLYVDAGAASSSRHSRRRPNRLRRLAAYLLFNPDPAIAWARRAARHPLVLDTCRDTSWVLSSSPPESAHVGAAMIAKTLSAKLLIDMRDGWLDEPLRPLLHNSRLMRWRESFQEAAILQRAHKIFVSSDVWKEMLDKRLRFTERRSVVLTNAYPSFSSKTPLRRDQSCGQGVSLIHAGRFGNSNLRRRPGLLLEPFHNALTDQSPPGKLTLIGHLNEQDRADIDALRGGFEAKRWRLETRPALSHEAVLDELASADGHLLLSATYGCIPAKLFDYIFVERPILAGTLHGSAVWRMGPKIPQMSLFDIREPTPHDLITRFLTACESETLKCRVPEEFSERYLSSVFLEQLL